jgi:hypothetical protein
MTELVEVQDHPTGDQGRSRLYCERLEEGSILFFPRIPFEFPAEDREFLLTQRQSGAAYHKNVAYRPSRDRLTGFAAQNREEADKLRAIMRSYSERASRLLAKLLPQYAAQWRLDFASFRPQEEEGRQIRLRARNDLLHVDSFPTRPTNGDRILRFFTNINPSRPRVWLTGDTFEGLAKRIPSEPGSSCDRGSSQAGSLAGAREFLPRRPRSIFTRAGHALLRLAQAAGLPLVDRSPYDEFMHRFHNYLKQNQSFQETCPKSRWKFPPGSSWIAFTDMVSHAVLSGQFALEQTYIVARDSLVLPHKAPARILESLAGCPVTLNR